MKYFNREKIEFSNRVANGESMDSVAKSAGVTRGIIHQWVSYHNAGMFKGREHLKTIGYVHTKKQPHITPKRVNQIAEEYIRNAPAPTQPTQEITTISPSIISELTRRVAMLEKVVLR